MLSYRHGFHAGNHADVLKHTVLVYLLGYLSRKDKPWCYVDTHAGAAGYDLRSEWARKHAEHETGIARLWGRSDLPAALADYVGQVRRFNAAAPELRFYPGSPQLAYQCARPDDRLRLFELHGNESEALQAHFAAAGPRVRVQAADGYAGLAAVLPPPSRRGLVLIDPSYEQHGDYTRVVTVLKEASKRFATGVYLVWYPQLQRREARDFPAALERMARAANIDWLNAGLSVRAPSADGFGMHGSGVFVLNPPWTLPAMLASVLPCLKTLLGQDGAAATTLEHRIG
jgi:23S rRNA (adenine2030-N6)-methyltransferase